MSNPISLQGTPAVPLRFEPMLEIFSRLIRRRRKFPTVWYCIESKFCVFLAASTQNTYNTMTLAWRPSSKSILYMWPAISISIDFWSFLKASSEKEFILISGFFITNYLVSSFIILPPAVSTFIKPDFFITTFLVVFTNSRLSDKSNFSRAKVIQ